eukprot:COSAG02_NODE_42831_length_380_cov_6.032028_1_plen_59_part_10
MQLGQAFRLGVALAEFFFFLILGGFFWGNHRGRESWVKDLYLDLPLRLSLGLPQLFSPK